MIYEHVTRRIIGAAIEVHRMVGPGLFEAVYEACLCHELDLRGVRYARQVDVPLFYKDLDTRQKWRADLIVEEKVVVELKSVERLDVLHHAQLLTYLRVTGLHVGLLINFNVPKLADGVVRRILTPPWPDGSLPAV